MVKQTLVNSLPEFYAALASIWESLPEPVIALAVTSLALFVLSFIVGVLAK